MSATAGTSPMARPQRRPRTTPIRIALISLAAAACASCATTPTADDAPPAPQTTTVTPFLLFHNGVADEAMRFYIDTFADARIVNIDYYGAGERQRVNVRVCSERPDQLVKLLCREHRIKVDR